MINKLSDEEINILLLNENIHLINNYQTLKLKGASEDIYSSIIIEAKNTCSPIGGYVASSFESQKLFVGLLYLALIGTAHDRFYS